MAKQQFNSVSDLLRHASDDDGFNEEFDEHIRQRDIVKTLFAMRTAKGVSQSSVAERLGVSQSRVSKIENGTDGDLRIRELEAYAQSLDCDVHLLFLKRNSTAVERVKQYAFCIKRELDRLADAAQKDDGIAKGVAGFFGDAFFNMLRIVQDACGKLPTRPDNSPYIRIGIAVECVDEDGEVSVGESKEAEIS